MHSQSGDVADMPTAVARTDLKDVFIMARFRRPLSTPVIHLIALAALLYTVYYLSWRARYSLNLDALWLALPLLLAEVYGALNFFVFTFMTWDVAPVPHDPAPRGHTVDILIPTYNEDLALLKMTILGALNVRYPHETWVLDDGRRPALQRLCEELGAGYLTRPDNRHGKAGNLNAALARTRGAFVAIFDADQVPLPDFLDHTLGYFADERVAFVQTPQEFYNLDSMQHRTDWQQRESWHEQALFYRVIQPGKNRWDSAFWCGSNSVMRRAALADAGGIATDSVTEDIHTSLRLHARGWRSIYHDEVLSMGLAPHDFVAFTVQRLRWAQGSMQVLRRDNPLIKRGLSVAQRVNYLSSMTTYFEAFQRLIYTLAPAVVLLTAVLPLHVGVAAFLLRFVPYFAFGYIANAVLGRGHFKALETERYNLLKMVTFIRAAFTLLGFEPRSFKVTPKAASAPGGALTHLLWPYYGLSIILLTGMAVGGLRLAGLCGGADGNTTALVISEGWALFNVWILARGVHAALRHVTRRGSYRFPVRVPITVRHDGQTLSGLTADLHQQGASLLLRAPLPAEAAVFARLHLPQGPIGVTLHVRSSRRSNTAHDGGLWCSGGSLLAHSPAEADLLHTFLIATMPRQLAAQGEATMPIPERIDTVA